MTAIAASECERIEEPRHPLIQPAGLVGRLDVLLQPARSIRFREARQVIG